MVRTLSIILGLLIVTSECISQGVGIPSKRGGIGFGNLSRFTGIRFNFKDRNVERINGINTTIWTAKNDDVQTGTLNGIAIGLPMAMGLENQRGVSVGIFGVGARRNISGINIGGLGVGAGESVSGITLAGLGIGAGGNLTGVNIALVGTGSGGNVRGFNFGGLGVGAGGSLTGFNIGGLGVGSGGDISGFNVGGLGVGSGEDVSGLSVSLLGVGAGGRVRGITLAGLGIGSGKDVQGIAIAGLGVGAPTVTGLGIALAVGGLHTRGIMIAPAWLRVGNRDKNKETGEVTIEEGLMEGISISAYNHIIGRQRGIALGMVNYTRSIRGVQLGLINIVRENPKGLRVLPIFNTRFGPKN